jgi:hypothetical protein
MRFCHCQELPQDTFSKYRCKFQFPLSPFAYMVLQLQSPETPTSQKKSAAIDTENTDLTDNWISCGSTVGHIKRVEQKSGSDRWEHIPKKLHVLNWLPEKPVEMQAVARIQQHVLASSAGVDPHWVGVQDQQEPPWQSSTAPSWPCYLNLLHYEDFHQILWRERQQTERNQAFTSSLAIQI